MNTIRLLVIFTVAFSLAALSGPLAGNLHLPAVPLARATSAPCVTVGITGACSPGFWYPAGPAMNTLLTPIFTDATAEYVNLESSTPSIDLTDSPCTPAVCGALTSSPNFLVTSPVAITGYSEVQFNQANNFWGVPFQFGDSTAGQQIRQGIAHMIDKTLFTADEASTSGQVSPLDNPVANPNSDNLLSPNPCAYDTLFPQTGSQCIVGSAAGTSYHLATATGADGYPWLQAPGSLDLNATAKHFVDAGLATGFNPTTSVLTGINPSASMAGNVPSFYIRNDVTALNDLGDSLASEICYLFTGSYVAPCQYLAIVRAGLTPFPGFHSPIGTVSLSWWMFTAEYAGTTFWYNNGLYFNYNSRFVSAVATTQPPCATQAVPSSSPADYIYLCSPQYDSLSSQMQNAPCITAPGDPVKGAASNLPTPPGNGLCAGTTQLSAISAGIQAEALFGGNAFTIPVYQTTSAQFGYLPGWTRIINSATVGLPNYFTWLNAYNPTPAVPLTVRQGFAQGTDSVNPYIATSPWDTYMTGNIYDSLHQTNPLNPNQQINWMSAFTTQVPNSGLLYTPPPGTITNYRFVLRNDLFFQDGTPVTAYDVAFSYITMLATGAFLGTGATSMTGITVLGPHQFDIGVNSLGPFTVPNLTSIPIVPGRYWTNAGSSTWDSAISSCESAAGCGQQQYNLSGTTTICSFSCGTVGAGLMTINPSQVIVNYDPLAARTLVGSGSWECAPVTTSGSSTTCSSTGNEHPNPGGSFTLTRFGNGLAPASSISGIYFRSAGNLALWTWASNGNPTGPTIVTFSEVVACFNQPVNINGSCAHWQTGLGSSGVGHVVGPIQVSIVARYFNVNWIQPFNWVTGPPTGIGQFAPILYEGSVTLNPCSVDPVNGYDC